MIEARIAAGKRRLEELDSRYRESLAYLECDLGRIRSAIGENVELLLYAGDDFYPELMESLQEYESVRQKGGTKSEEENRLAKRAPLEDEIVDLVKGWESEIVKRQTELREQETGTVETVEDSAAGESPAANEPPGDEEILALRNRLEAATSKRDDFKSRLERNPPTAQAAAVFRNAESRNKRSRKET